MIYFNEYTSGYAGRTLHNVNVADATLALAVDFNTGGEVLTRSYCDKLKKPYFRFNMFANPNNLYAIAEQLTLLKVKTLNIAGNGLYTFAGKGLDAQDLIDEYIYQILYGILLTSEVDTIVSGGQTGVDEAGLKAGEKLGLKSICTAPKGWMFRNALGVDICNKQKFQSRFGIIYDLF